MASKRVSREINKPRDGKNVSTGSQYRQDETERNKKNSSTIEDESNESTSQKKSNMKDEGFDRQTETIQMIDVVFDENNNDVDYGIGSSIINNVWNKIIPESKKDDEIKVTFHVHLPKNIENLGRPVVLGNIKELGEWQNPIVKLSQKYQNQNPTYWQSNPVTISPSNLRRVIRYRYAIYTKLSLFTTEGKIELEGKSVQDNRTLDIGKPSQFDIWKSSTQEGFHLNPNDIDDFAFVKHIYRSVRNNNLKDKVMEYQHLLALHKDLTTQASNLELVAYRMDEKLREKRLFLCLILGYYVLRQPEFYELPNEFASSLLLDAFEGYKQDTLPLEAKDQIYTAIMTLVQHDAFQMQFDWLIIFEVAAEIDPKCTFVDHLRSLKYPDDDMLAKFIKGVAIIKPYIDKIDPVTYVKLAKWLIQLCHNMDSLSKLWNDVLLHDDEFDQSVSNCFIDRVRMNIAQDCDAANLEYQFKKLPKVYRDSASEIFRHHALYLLESTESTDSNWTNENITAIKYLFQDDNMNWQIELTSESHNLELFNLFSIFPELLDYWFYNNISDSKKNKISKICVSWFKDLLSRLDINEDNFVFSVFQRLELMYPFLNKRTDVWRDLTNIAIESLKECSDVQIFDATKSVAQIKHDEVKKLFFEKIKEILNHSVQQVDEQLLDNVFIICGNKTLYVSDIMIEGILYHIMTVLQSKSDVTENHLNILKTNYFWIAILRATGSVTKLNSHSLIKDVKASINELARLLQNRTINIQLLQQVVKYSDERLLLYFNAAAASSKESSGISQNEISQLRMLCGFQSDVLYKFYDEFCSFAQVTDVNDYIQDIKQQQHMESLGKLSLEQLKFHEKILDSAERCYKFNRSRTFRNIYEVCIQEDAAATNVEYIAQTLIPIVFEKYYDKCERLFKDWEKFKCSDAYLLWKNVTDVEEELDLMGINRSQELVQTLDHLSKIPRWIERFEQLGKVLETFKIPHNDWLSESIRTLNDDSMELVQLNKFFDDLHKNLPRSNDFWNVIRELSVADKLMDFLEKISEYDTNYDTDNGGVDYSDEMLIREDMLLSLFQVKELICSLMDKGSISDFLSSLLLALKGNHTLSEKIAFCNNNNITLQNMYSNISNRKEVAMEEIKNAVLNGSFTFTYDEKENECLVFLTYPSKHDVKYNMNEILDLRRKTLLIARQKSMVTKTNEDNKIWTEVSKNAIDEFASRVDIAQEIINLVSTLTRIGHLSYRKFERKLQGTNNMKDYRKSLIKDLEKWQETVNDAHKRCYYLTFFSAQNVLSFYDYFTSERLDEKNEEECKTLIRLLNNKAKLPSHKDLQGTSHGSKKSKNHLDLLCEIGNELKRIYGNGSKQPRKFKSAKHSAGSGIITKSKLFVASCADKAQVPNVILSLFADCGQYPEPWQILICTTSTTMEELAIFIKRCFFAPSNGYENYLFCIARLELLDFELQYNFVNYVKEMQSENENKNYLLALIICKKPGMSNCILDQYSSEVHEIDDLDTEEMQEIYQELCPNVTCVSSGLSGQGKTEWIKESSYSKQKVPYSFLISDGMDFTCLVKRLNECNLKQIQSLHINILSTDYPEDVNLFLFELLTFKMVSYNEMMVSVPDTSIFIEIASSTTQNLNHFPVLRYLHHEHLSWNIKNFRVSKEITSPIQVACHFLNLYDLEKIDEEETFYQTLNSIKDPLSEELCQRLVTKYFLGKNEIKILSFKYIEIFINILADQLIRFSSSQYFLKLELEETDIKSTMIKSFIDISKDAVINTIKTKSLQIEPYENDDFAAIQSVNSNHSILFFNSQNSNSFSILYHDENQVPDNIKSLLKSQAIGNPENWELDNYNTMSVNELLKKLEMMARTSSEKLDLPAYALSMDNLITMALILLRVRANIPVIICGEAGWGKTSLITYLAKVVEVQFQALNLHAGIDENTIVMFMDDVLKKAEEDETWVFFDEINTCDHLGLLADIISNRKFQGKSIHPNVRFFSACNPYRLRSKTKDETDLTSKINEYEVRSNLVYQVNPLPDQILDYTWYCGIPKPDCEFKYIQIMVEKELKDLANPILVELLFASQKFIRKVEKSYSVSLRDIKRSITLVKFFYNSLENRPAYRSGHKYPPDYNPTKIIRSYVLALSLCYHSRLCEQSLRKRYNHEMGQILKNHKAYIGENAFDSIVRDEQEDYINRMRCPPNVAKNEALLENVLAMIACILTRIPLFLIGPPGSSKSLAIQLISSNLRGPDSDDMYFKNLPRVYLVTYQCTALSTSDSIIKVFDKANKYQEATTKKIFVVLLENVEFAETNPFNPLKILHNLLEQSYPATGSTVSTIGISSRELDNSKISRALLVRRPQFDLDDVVDTVGLLLNTKNVEPEPRDTLISLAKSYSVYEKHGQTSPNFHGLRDFYALIYRLSLDEITPENIQTTLGRNFGGTENNFAKIFEEYFEDALKTFKNNNPWSYKPISAKRLIYSNLNDSNARHLMVIGKSGSIVNSLTYQLRIQNLDPVVILGSKFPDDQDNYMCSILDRIMACIETGGTLILTDLEIIYGCLYNLWDQNYMSENKNDIKCFTKIALETYANLLIYVPPSFKCIIVIDEANTHSIDPVLLSRFEKQKISIDDVLDNRQKVLVENLSDWASRTSTLLEDDSVTNEFSQKDLFVGFDKDVTLQSLVINITRYNSEAEDNEILEKCKECLMAMASSDGIVRAEKSTLECDELDRWKRVYFDQKHNCLRDCLVSLIDQEKYLTDSKGQLVIVNTFSGINVDIKCCLQESLKHQVYNLSSFRTESQLSNLAKSFYFESTDQVLIIQCDITAINAAKCINLTKSIIEQFRNEYSAQKEVSVKHVCIILHIQRDYEPNVISSNFFDWKHITIESLESQKISLIDLLDKSLYEIINSELFDKIVDSTTPFETILNDELSWCLSCIKYQHSNESDETIKNHISMLSKEILNNLDFIQCIKEKTFEWISENCENWQYEVALDKEFLSKFSCFSLALQNRVKIIIKQTAAKILYSLEKLSAMTTFFSNKSIKEPEMKQELFDLWKQYFMSNTIIDINKLCEPKPSAYIIPSAVINDLKFPFSPYFMNQINYYKDCYYEELDILKQDSEDVKEEDHIEDFKNSLISTNPNFENLQKYSKLYYNDFTRIILSTYTGKLASNKELDFILKYLIEDKIANDPFVLHIYWWNYAEKILVQLKLVEAIPNIVTKTKNDAAIYGKLDLYLFGELINLTLQNICDDKPWEESMNKVLSVSDKINDSKSISNLHLLLICNDLLKIDPIPLKKVKEIIQSAKSAKKQEFITVDIINLVFVSLDNNDDITPIRSFIKRSLKLIPLESEARLVLYENLFSRNPFKLASSIIEKIFFTEYQQDSQTFFAFIENSEEALQLSSRLKAINDNIGGIDSSMAELCCEIIQKIFGGFELNELSPYFKHSIETCMKQQQTFALQQIASIALLKEVLRKFCDDYIQENNFLNRLLIKEINDVMEINHSFIQSLQSYFEHYLNQQTFFNNKMLKKEFPWLGNFTDAEMNHLPGIWKPKRSVNFEDFHTSYNCNLTHDSDKYPFLSIFFKNCERLTLVKHLYPIIRFVKILSLKLEYHLTRKAAQTMTFHEFIKKESANEEEYNNLKSLFDEFAFGWNSVINYIIQYQSKELPLNKPIMNLELPVIFGLIEQRDTGVYLCAILDLLIGLHNEFLDGVMDIPIGKCESLKFLENASWNHQTSEKYFITSKKVTHALDINFINYEWNDEILRYSQRNSEVTDGENVIFDLQTIEKKLAKKLVLDKVYFEMENNQFYLKSFPFKHELFHNSPRILFDIKKILPQEPISEDKMSIALGAMFQLSKSSLSLSNSVSLPELFFLFETILCSIKELSIKNNKIAISDFVNQWLKLARYNEYSIDILGEFSLNHIVQFYELIEEQVATKIHDIDDKFKDPLTQSMKDSINNALDYYDSEDQNKQLISAKEFALALKKFIYRFLLVDSEIKNLNLNVYFLDSTLGLWTEGIKEELVETLFPTDLFVSHAYNSYNFVVEEIEKATNNKPNKSSTPVSSSTNRKTNIKKFKKFAD